MQAKHKTLGGSVVPLNYCLYLEPDFSTFRYHGKVTISVEAKSRTKKVRLNASELTIKSVYVNAGPVDGKAAFKANEKEEEIEIELPAPVLGPAELTISFEGVHNDRLYGFYRSMYREGKSTRYILTTQFEAATARKSFPCFDEPEFKATFDLSLLVDKEFECVSNMPIKSEKQQKGGKKLVTFNRTPVMSCYLLYIGVGKFERIKSRVNGIDISVLSTPGKKQYLSTALEYAKSSIAFYEKYFAVKYPLPKMDLLAIPDFAAGAMENWGAITFREVELLADEKTPLARKQRIAEVIAHELAHQWFGDLVTMKWWNDLWLNESFATFMASKANDAVFPEWNVKTKYISDTVALALGADQLKSTHPISVMVNTPEDIEQLFDEISYEKGGSVLNMLDNYVGKETFRKGISSYLKKYRYSNTEAKDLWNSIDEEAKKSGKDRKVAYIARSWIEKAGYPVISARRSNGSILLSQSRFTITPNSDATLWPAPIKYKYEGKSREEELLLEKKESRVHTAGKRWIKINYGQNGVYRCTYEPTLLEGLGELIRDKELSSIDSWGIENDLFAMVRSGRTKMDEYLEFVKDYCFDARYPLNNSVMGHLRFSFGMFYNNTAIRNSVSEVLKDYSKDIIKQVGWTRSNDEDSNTTLLRGSAIMASGISGEQSTLSKATKMFYSYITSGKEIDPNIKGAVYGLASWTGKSETAEIFRKRYLREEIPEERNRLLASMAMSSSPVLVRKALDFSMSGEVRLQDTYILPANAAANPSGRAVVWEWTKSNWKKLMKMHGIGTHMLGRYVDNLRFISDDRQMADVKHFFSIKTNMRDDLKMPLLQALEVMQANKSFIAANSSR